MMITSVSNSKVQAIRKLQLQAKARREQGAFVAEGVRLAEEALQAGCEAQLVLFAEGLDERGKATLQGFTARGVPAEQVSQTVMKAISETETPQGLLVLLKHQPLSLPPSLDFIIILDEVRDPGNLGTILRTAAAAGVQAVLLAPGCVDAFSPKVVRAGMGAHFRLPVRQPGWDGIKRLVQAPGRDLRIYLADSAAGIPYTQADWQSPVALIIGGEAGGAGSESRLLAGESVHIPMPGGSESLNAAVAAGILIFEVVRQRGEHAPT
jgi:TrmH family RNA methyltransferase